MEDRKIRLAGMIYESLSNGPGLRRVLFSQGCRHKCKNCFNPHTHSFTGGELMDMDEIIVDIVSNPMIKGVTFSGGDPLEQAEKFSYIAKKVREKGKSVWIYTGYTFEEILSKISENKGWEKLLNYTDVLVDGKFDTNKKDEKLKFRGSANQRIIDIRKSLNTKEIYTINC
ncbi:anaerobic ribonucleoside-triphosphate reductase-activating protein [Clostridium pasteurianum DSM 525 = ATCC 6013]|uniref:Anaerobic ribonucleoside-triphosphate reductase-activating protein n=1 Tax=Clostridium pasteurianum DSM 525 = ATCC 6013 TaxID=1262449 RepID=A0A0H3J5T2_CLOPA|nr:anaerobic ribonucleoside-triphosphate reductase activating protein [Clostridium pasteurianum]AJA46290.1 anaerobic ribonucleoside-triphosphate reductase-activating protein [Clostridium pasteurianum DSM 525 = ATCC 6013]AJA50278.1 anaerobic ribonucleoside-triphosphate reductase-activating protein [Clostridium pasteurianum DSM 525 = ATCC 6013]AOZ73741.1 ribonucleoside-triphosphate reductase activating protein [Clostridium pasteurianum DSM 525 = ATCC 6013]AOZ77538.1 ribonucleoside-triphosphate re